MIFVHRKIRGAKILNKLLSTPYSPFFSISAFLQQVSAYSDSFTRSSLLCKFWTSSFSVQMSFSSSAFLLVSCFMSLLCRGLFSSIKSLPSFVFCSGVSKNVQEYEKLRIWEYGNWLFLFICEFVKRKNLLVEFVHFFTFVIGEWTKSRS